MGAAARPTATSPVLERGWVEPLGRRSDPTPRRLEPIGNSLPVPAQLVSHERSLGVDPAHIGAEGELAEEAVPVSPLDREASVQPLKKATQHGRTRSRVIEERFFGDVEPVKQLETHSVDG